MTRRNAKLPFSVLLLAAPHLCLLLVYLVLWGYSYARKDAARRWAMVAALAAGLAVLMAGSLVLTVVGSPHAANVGLGLLASNLIRMISDGATWPPPSGVGILLLMLAAFQKSDPRRPIPVAITNSHPLKGQDRSCLRRLTALKWVTVPAGRGPAAAGPVEGDTTLSVLLSGSRCVNAETAYLAGTSGFCGFLGRSGLDNGGRNC